MSLPLPQGIVLVDHGSKVAASNQLLESVARMFQQATNHPIVTTAHMELAAPDLNEAFARCCEQGAKSIVVHPYFLGPGRHVTEDIPRLAAQASELNDDIPFVVTPPLGLHSALTTVIEDRIRESVEADA